MYYTYILYSENSDSYYIGQTNSIAKRLVRHNSGYVKSTKEKRPWRLVFLEEYETRVGSMRREKELKSYKSKKVIRQLIDASR